MLRLAIVSSALLYATGCCCCGLPDADRTVGVEIGDPGTPTEKTDPKAPPKPDMGKWKINKQTDPMTDKTVVFATLEGEGRGGLLSQRQTMTVRCQEGKTEVMFELQDSIADMDFTSSGAIYKVQFRWDEEKATGRTLADAKGISTTYFSRDGKNDAKRIMKHDKLLIGYTKGVGGESAYATYKLTGGAEAMKPIKEACKW